MMYYDLESGMADNSFEDKYIRQGFIRKVFGILTIQLALTTAIAAPFSFVKGLTEAAATGPALIISLILLFGCVTAVGVCKSARRTYPWNYLFLLAITATEGFLLGVITSQIKSELVLLAAGLTAIVTFGLCMYAMQTKYDFTTLGGVVTCVSIVMFVLAMIAIFGGFGAYAGSPFILVFSILGVLAVSFYMVWDIQLLMGGHKYQLSADEYVFASLALYLDVIEMFLHILRILQYFNRN